MGGEDTNWMKKKQVVAVVGPEDYKSPLSASTALVDDTGSGETTVQGVVAGARTLARSSNIQAVIPAPCLSFT